MSFLQESPQFSMNSRYKRFAASLKSTFFCVSGFNFSTRKLRQSFVLIAVLVICENFIFNFACLPRSTSCKLSMKLCQSLLVFLGRRQIIFHSKTLKYVLRWQRRKFSRNLKYGDVELCSFVYGIDKWPACPKRDRDSTCCHVSRLWRLLLLVKDS